MGTHAERVAIHDRVNRADQDAFALASHRRRSRPSTRAASTPRSCRWPSATRRAARRSSHVDESPRRDTTAEALARLKPAFDLPTGPRIAATPRSAPSRPATRRASPTAPPRPSSPASGRSSGSASSPRADRRLRPGRGRARWLFLAPSRASSSCSPGPTSRSRPSTSSRSTRPSRRRPSPTAASWDSTGRGSTSTVAPSPWATPSAPAARACSRRSSTSSRGAGVATAWRRLPWRRRLGGDGGRAGLRRTARRGSGGQPSLSEPKKRSGSNPWAPAPVSTASWIRRSPRRKISDR